MYHSGYLTSGRRRPSLTYGANISVQTALPSPYRRFWWSTGSFSPMTSLLGQFRLNYFVHGADLFILRGNSLYGGIFNGGIFLFSLADTCRVLMVGLLLFLCGGFYLPVWADVFRRLTAELDGM